MIRFDLGDGVDLSLPEPQRAQIEAQRLAKWLRDTGLPKLRARGWREVAILSPRKAWLRALREALIEQRIPVEVQSECDRQGEHPAYAWLTALLTIMVDPNASYEIVGVLREVFGISDDELARFAQGDVYKLQTNTRRPDAATSPGALNLLTRLRLTIPQQPLFSAVREIVRKTQLRERLRIIAQRRIWHSLHELDKLLSGGGSRGGAAGIAGRPSARAATQL